MSNHKSFFKKLTDSFASFLPGNNGKDKVEKKDNAIAAPGTRRLLPTGFDSIGQSARKRPKLNHDLFNFPASRLVKPQNEITYNFNDGASEISDHSNASISTSGVSSLNPKSRKAEMSNERSNKTRSFDQNTYNISNNCSNDYMSSSSRRILEKLSKLSTPITCADKIKCQMRSDVISGRKPYDRPIPKLESKRVTPIKAVTVSGSSNMCSQARPKLRSFGYKDNVDLDDIDELSNCKAKIIPNKPIGFINLPLLSKTVSTNTEESYASCLYDIKSEDLLTFEFSMPKNLNDSYDSDKVSDLTDEEINVISPKFELKTIIAPKITEFPKIELKQKGWRCETCFTENENDNNVCIHCENIAKANKEKKVVIKPLVSENNDQLIKLQNAVEFKSNTNEEINKNEISAIKDSATISNNFGNKLPNISTTFSFGFSSVDKPSIASSNVTNSTIRLETGKSDTSFTFGSIQKVSEPYIANNESFQNSMKKSNEFDSSSKVDNISKPTFHSTLYPVDSKKVEESTFQFPSSDNLPFGSKITQEPLKPVFQFSTKPANTNEPKIQQKTEQPFSISTSKPVPDLSNSAKPFQFSSTETTSSQLSGNMFGNSSSVTQSSMMFGNNSTSNNVATLFQPPTTDSKLPNIGLFNFGKSSIGDKDLPELKFSNPSNESKSINFGNIAKTPSEGAFQFGANNSIKSNVPGLQDSSPFTFSSNSQSSTLASVPVRRIIKSRRTKK